MALALTAALPASAPVIAKNYKMLQEHAQSMGLPTTVDAGLSPPADADSTLPLTLVLLGLTLVAAGSVVAVRRRVTS